MTIHSQAASARILRLSTALFASVAISCGTHRAGHITLPQPSAPLDSPAPLASWPWPHAAKSVIANGVTRWEDRDKSDDTVVQLFDFDFSANPNLRFELYDQDEDDAKPHDNQADYWPQTAANVTRHLNAIGRGPVIAAWNGLFFMTTYRSDAPKGIAQHVAPVILNGHVYYNVGNIRWTFGVKYTQGKPSFQTLHTPDRAAMLNAFTYGAAGAQCLVRNGLPLRLQPYPGPNDPPVRQPVPSTPEEAGYIPVVNHIRTTRISMAWSHDNKHFYLLFVKQPDTETASVAAFRARTPKPGGWMVSDEQKFWLSFGVWGAVNSDSGDVTQVTVRRPDHKYEFYPARWATATQKQICTPDFPDAPPGGGTLMYFYVRDTGK